MSTSLTDYDILCLSHLRWQTTLFQRPQQLMMRFDAMGLRVFYLSQWSSRSWLGAFARGRRGDLAGRGGHGLVWRNWPMTPGVRFSPLLERLNTHLLARAVRRFLAGRQKRPLLVWLYFPWGYPLLDRLPHAALVYDCMDPFAWFRAQAGNRRLAGQERSLVARADVVFTGGPSLQASKEGLNPRTYCFPSGVDVDHFAKALDATNVPPPDDVARLPRPIMGYWGALDERIDFQLLDRLCRRWPGGSVVLLGPLVGMRRLPLDPGNLHYLGEKQYAQLPAYLASFDVCLLPFVRSSLTEALSPTKTPEYLAGGRPVVSTRVPDVERLWGDVVEVADGPEQFVAAVERALRRSVPDPALAEAARRRARTWEEIARAMRGKIEAAIAEKERAGRRG